MGRALNFKEIALEFMQAGQADRAYSTAIAIPDGGIRVRALEEIEPLLPLELQQKALEQTLVAIPEMVEDEKGQSFALQRLIEKLPAAMLVPCRAIVEAMPNRYRRFWPLEQVSKPVV